jgi:hypothetical protein
LRIRWTHRYAVFREALSNAELDNFRSTLINQLHANAVPAGGSEVVLRGPRPFKVYLHRSGTQIWLLAGHFVRRGEPTKALVLYLAQAFKRLDAGAAPDDDI